MGSREIAVSSCPSSVQDVFYAGAGVLRSEASEEQRQFAQILDISDRRKKQPESKKKVRQESKFDRLQKAAEMYPGSRVDACMVDTENEFLWCGTRYRIDGAVAQYQAVDTDEGDYYAMDRVLVVHTGKDIHCFLDQSAVLLDPNMIKTAE